MKRSFRHFITLILIVLAGVFTTSGRTIWLLGDSNTWLAGQECKDSRGWATYLASALSGDTIVNLAKSGATWSHTPETRESQDYYEVLHADNVIFNQIPSMSDSEPSLIIIMAGTNDAWFADKRPHIFDAPQIASDSQRDPGEVAGLANAVSHDLNILKERNPKARLVVVTCAPNTKAPFERMLLVNEIVARVSAESGAQVIRLDLQGPVTAENLLDFTYDGVHTNSAGAKAVADFILSNFHLTTQD